MGRKLTGLSLRGLELDASSLRHLVWVSGGGGRDWEVEFGGVGGGFLAGFGEIFVPKRFEIGPWFVFFSGF